MENKRQKLCFEFKENQGKVLKQSKNRITDLKVKELMTGQYYLIVSK